MVSDKCSKSVTVQVIRKKFFPKYDRFATVQKKYMAHDEEEICEVGDFVRIVPCRPMSRKKRFKVIDILKKRVVL